MTDQIVFRDGNRIRFTGRVSELAHSQFLGHQRDAIRLGYSDLELDFREATTAFPKGTVPILCAVERERRRGVEATVVLPENEDLKRHFMNCDWAYSLDPSNHKSSGIQDDRRMSTRHFTSAHEQKKLVDGFLDIVMKQTTIGRDELAGLEWSINEVTDNVLTHAQSLDGGFAQVSTFPKTGKVDFVVADSGRGVLSTLREGHRHLKTDAQALSEAIKPGITRNPDIGQGNGLAGTLRVATMSGGTFALISGRAQVEARPTVKTSPHSEITGTIVHVELGTRGGFRFADAVNFGNTRYQPVDFIETAYLTEEGDGVLLKLRDESSGLGSRPAGKEIRQKCLNLLRAEPGRPLILDWSDVSLVSSSFADELVGKLFVELGPLAFSGRIRNQGMGDLVRGLIDKAIMQRTAQAFAAPGKVD